MAVEHVPHRRAAKVERKSLMIKITLAILVTAVIALLIYAKTKPDSFTITRSIVIEAPAARIYALIVDLKAFNTWNPFAAADPGARIAYEGAASGKGAAYTWQGDKSGAGRMEITDTTEPTRLAMKLDFAKPMAANNTVDFTLLPQGSGTRVTWAMSGAMPYLHKVMTVFFDSDKIVGGEFAKGLATLKVLAEKK
jgi:uncharacterized protein YndB with AHSA1/START domain